jgi:hypothetical protein
MIKSSIEKLSETIGFEIGNSDDITQANLVNGLCKGLANSMDERNLNMQLCCIADKLDSKSHKVLKSLVEFIQLKEKP